MTTEADRPTERRVPLLIEPEDAIAFLFDNVGDMLAISALVKEHIHCQVRNEISDSRYTF
jgi:hypothetical protein